MRAEGGLISGKAFHKRVAASRSTGQLNLNDCGLTEIPKAAWDATEPVEGDETPWWSVEVIKSLSFQNNEITHVPPELFSLVEVETVNFTGNQLCNMPPEISNLRELRVLLLSKNQLSRLPEAVAELLRLVKLDCSDNPSLTFLPTQLGVNQPSLSEVSANKCSLSEFPTSLSSARGLRTLNLASNALTSMPATALQGFGSLTALDLSRNRLSALPAGVLASCVGLVSLSLSNNQIKELPSSIGKCKALVTLTLAHNHLRSLPAELAFCPSLAELSVRDNALSDIGAGVPRLQALRLLDVCNNELTNLPPALGYVTSLRAMPLTGNPMRSIPRNVRDGPTSKLLEQLRLQDPSAGPAGPIGAKSAEDCSGTFGAAAVLAREDSASVLASRAARQLVLDAAAKKQAVEDGAQVHVYGGGGAVAVGSGAGKKSAQALSIRNLGLSELPDDIFEAGEVVTSLEASGNKITAVPTERLADLFSLSLLDLTKNQLQAWPLPVVPDGCLPQLASVLLSFNRALPALPPNAFSSCAASLTRLELSGCPRAAQSLNSLATCTALKHIDLSHCSLPALPASVAPLASLTALLLSDNGIAELPVAHLATLTDLEELDVRNNSLTTLPPQLALLPRLRSLAVEGNILRTIRRPVLQKGTPALLEYLKTRLPAQ